MIRAGELILEFVYHLFDPPLVHPRSDGRRPVAVKAVTNCAISLGIGGPTIASADSFCSVADNFSRKVGRELALRRACQNLSRGDRGAILDAYYNRHQKGVRSA